MQIMKRNLFLFLVSLIIIHDSYAQDLLTLASCDFVEYEVNDNSDVDGDGDICESMIILSNSASYTGNVCQLSNIKWTVLVDLDADGTDDLEYSSSLPTDDITLDDTNGNGIPDLHIPMTTNGEVQSFQLPDIEGPNSNHKVRWLVSDDCDLGDLCVTNFSVVDKKAPTPFCLSIATIIYDNVDLEIEAEYFNLGVFDNCTDQENIRFSFSGESVIPRRLITCDDVINSPILVDIFFWDQNDNTDFCTVYLQVIPTNEVECLEYHDINGYVLDHKGDPVQNVEVELSSGFFLPDFPKNTTTNEDGFYDFGSHTSTISYKLDLKKTDSKMALLSTLDLVLIQLHILDIIPFDSPYRILAADINGDESIKASDLTNLRKLTLGILSDETSDDFWKFYGETYEFPDPTNPWPDLIEIEDFNDQYNISSFSEEQNFNFIGVKLGNVNY